MIDKDVQQDQIQIVKLKLVTRSLFLIKKILTLMKLINFKIY